MNGDYIQDIKRHFRKPKYTKENIKKDSNRYCVEKFGKFRRYTPEIREQSEFRSPSFVCKIVEMKPFRYGRPSWMCQIQLGGEERLFSLYSPFHHYQPCARPLGTYKTKMAVRTGERSILAGLSGTCQKKQGSVNSLENNFTRHHFITQS